MAEKGASLFGSGWVWLVLDSGKKLTILTLPNQDSPLTEATTRSSASTSGNTPTTSSIATYAPTTSRPYGTSSIGTSSPPLRAALIRVLRQFHCRYQRDSTP